MKAKRGRKGTAPHLINFCASWWWVVNARSRPLYLREKDPVSVVQKPGWAHVPVLMGARNLASHQESIPRPSSPQQEE